MPDRSVSVVVDEMVERRGDCGVCGLPAAVKVEVTHDGYMVPRCFDHAESPPYQAEARLDELLGRSPAMVEALAFYADPENFANGEVGWDTGERARAVLGGEVQGRADASDATAVLRMERDWLLDAWAAAGGVPREQAEADLLAWTAKWRESAIAESTIDRGDES